MGTASKPDLAGWERHCGAGVTERQFSEWEKRAKAPIHPSSFLTIILSVAQPCSARCFPLAHGNGRGGQGGEGKSGRNESANERRI